MKNLATQAVDQKLARKLFDDDFRDKKGVIYNGGIRVNDKLIGFVCVYENIDGEFFYLYRFNGKEYEYVVAPSLSRFLAYPEEYIKEAENFGENFK